MTIWKRSATNAVMPVAEEWCERPCYSSLLLHFLCWNNTDSAKHCTISNNADEILLDALKALCVIMTYLSSVHLNIDIFDIV